MCHVSYKSLTQGPILGPRNGEGFTVSCRASALGRELFRLVCEKVPPKAGAGLVLTHKARWVPGRTTGMVS